jgi:hypothetical protein
MLNLTPADLSDSAGAQMILDAIRKRWPWVKHLFADGAYDWTRWLGFDGDPIVGVHFTAPAAHLPRSAANCYNSFGFPLISGTSARLRTHSQ